MTSVCRINCAQIQPKRPVRDVVPLMICSMIECLAIPTKEADDSGKSVTGTPITELRLGRAANPRGPALSQACSGLPAGQLSLAPS